MPFSFSVFGIREMLVFRLIQLEKITIYKTIPNLVTPSVEIIAVINVHSEWIGYYPNIIYL